MYMSSCLIDLSNYLLFENTIYFVMNSTESSVLGSTQKHLVIISYCFPNTKVYFFWERQIFFKEVSTDAASIVMSSPKYLFFLALNLKCTASV